MSIPNHQGSLGHGVDIIEIYSLLRNRPGFALPVASFAFVALFNAALFPPLKMISFVMGKQTFLSLLHGQRNLSSLATQHLSTKKIVSQWLFSVYYFQEYCIFF